ncbi:MAG TPA: PEP/pyruvate-binding domain-containing protein [Herpetosiphonaceae bacterium]
MKKLVLWLEDAEAAEEAVAGAKAAAAARERQAGGEGAPGFVVPVAVYSTAPHGEITPDVESAIEAAYEQLGGGPVTVTASPTDPDAPAACFEQVASLSKLLSAIESCWQSLTAPEALDYFQERGIDGSAIEMGVLVQSAP